MLCATILALALSLSSATAQYKGFNYGATFTNGKVKAQSDFEAEFKTAQGLVGASGFSSARLYTMIQGGTTNSPISAIPAAISTKTTLLLGLWASVPQEVFNNEVAALSAAIKQYGTAFTDLIVGISVGSEDLYRISPTGILNKSGVGAEPATLVSYIEQTRKAIAGTGASSKPVGHVETWNDWTNGSNSAVVQACDFLGMDAYPYFEGTKQNAIADGVARFSDALSATRAAAQGKPVWVTETGWPVSGETVNQAVPSVNNAKAYWQQVGCKLFGSVNTWWYTLQDAAPDTPSPSFGIVGSTLTTTPIYELTCPAGQTDNFASTARPSGSGSPSTSAGGSATSAGSGTGAGASATGGGSGAPRSTSSASGSTAVRLGPFAQFVVSMLQTVLFFL